MTAERLDQYKWLLREIEQIEAGIRKLEVELEEDKHTKWNNPSLQAEYVEKTKEIENILSDRLSVCTKEAKKLRSFLDCIPDPFIREIFRLRFVEGLQYNAISFSMMDCGRYSADLVKKKIQRYLEKTE